MRYSRLLKLMEGLMNLGTNPQYWNVVECARSRRLLMSISTAHYRIAEQEKDKLQQKYPSRTYSVIRTNVLEAHKQEVGE